MDQDVAWAERGTDVAVYQTHAVLVPYCLSDDSLGLILRYDVLVEGSDELGWRPCLLHVRFQLGQDRVYFRTFKTRQLEELSHTISRIAWRPVLETHRM